MKLVHFTFNNFFDYQIVLDILKNPNNSFLPSHLNLDKLQISFTYLITGQFAITHIGDKLKPLNIQFTTTLEVTENTE